MLDVAAEHGFTFDAVQMPVNVLDTHFRSFARQVLPRLTERRIGAIGMKSLASGVLAEGGVATPVECLHYVLTLPVSVLVVGIDSTETLEQAISAARSFRPLSEGAVQSLLSRTADMARRGEYEGYKTTSVFDGTARHPEWLGDELE
jgi:aryl-alcohol dehydrogenase-like predicted oxidoreductase